MEFGLSHTKEWTLATTGTYGDKSPPTTQDTCDQRWLFKRREQEYSLYIDDLHWGRVLA